MKPAKITQPAVKKPAHEVRVGNIRATIWLNDTPQGPRYNTTFERSYRDNDEWKSSDAFGRDDLLTVGFVAQEALRWIVEQKQGTAPAVN